jgi:sulfide:quinone oxidoreductase
VPVPQESMMVNHLHHELKNIDETWEMVIIDENDIHYYQPGFLFLPFDIYSPEAIQKPIREFLPPDVPFFEEKNCHDSSRRKKSDH